MRILVANSKGGTGKSSVATQILAPWLSVQRKKKIDYVVYDRINASFYANLNERNDFFNVKVSDSTETAIVNITESPDCVFDVGGNEDCKDMLSALSSDGCFPFFDVCAIPVKQDLDDMKAARAVADVFTLKRRQGSKLLWFLVGAEKGASERELREDFINFFGDDAVDGYSYVKGGIKGLIAEYKPDDTGYIPFPHCLVDAIVKHMSIPIWQAGHIDRDAEQQELNKLLSDSKADPKKITALRHYIRTFNLARQYCDSVLQPLFDGLTDRLRKFL